VVPVRRGALAMAIVGFVALGCRGTSAASAASVAAVTVTAAAVGAINMSQHVCFTVCPPGTACDSRTGFCERGHDDSACGGHGCPDGKSCDSSGLLPRCVEQTSRTDEAPSTADIYRLAHYPLFPFFYPLFPFFVSPALEPLPP
jgi:hypothetical protein